MTGPFLVAGLRNCQLASVFFREGRMAPFGPKTLSTIPATFGGRGHPRPPRANMRQALESKSSTPKLSWEKIVWDYFLRETDVVCFAGLERQEDGMLTAFAGNARLAILHQPRCENLRVSFTSRDKPQVTHSKGDRASTEQDRLQNILEIIEWNGPLRR